MLGVLLPSAMGPGQCCHRGADGVLQWMAALPGLRRWRWRGRLLWMGCWVFWAVALVLPWSWGLRLWGAAWMLLLLLWQAPRVPTAV